MDMNHYNILTQIKKLYDNNKYISLISSKKDTESIEQKIIFKEIINEESQYIIEILSKNYINVQIPIKNSNYKYSTCLYNMEDVLEYLKIHKN